MKKEVDQVLRIQAHGVKRNPQVEANLNKNYRSIKRKCFKTKGNYLHTIGDTEMH